MDIPNIKLMSLLLISLLSLNCVFAIGVSSPYWKSNPLKMYPGETRDVVFSLVSRVDAETAKAFVNIEDDAGIAKITSGSEYVVEPGTVNTKVRLKITIPESASVGDNYEVKFLVNGAPLDESGMVQLAVGYKVNFPVEVVAKEEVPANQISDEVPQQKEISSGLILGFIIAILVVVISILFLVLRKKRV